MPDDDVSFTFSVGKSASALASSAMTSEDRDITMVNSLVGMVLVNCQSLKLMRLLKW